jgi:hypothetical protein
MSCATLRAAELRFSDTILGLDFEPSFFIDVSDVMERKKDPARMHESQMQSMKSQSRGDRGRGAVSRPAKRCPLRRSLSFVRALPESEGVESVSRMNEASLRLAREEDLLRTDIPASTRRDSLTTGPAIDECSSA